jgi:glc operon protein GlcG
MSNVDGPTSAEHLLRTKPALTMEVAQLIGEAALARAVEAQVSVSIAILDDGAHLLYFVRMTDSHVGTVEIAIAKAATAVKFKRPSQNFAQGIADGALALLAMPGLVPFPGGVPLLHGGTLMGAIGVSGAAPDMDAQIAAAGASVVEHATASAR